MEKALAATTAAYDKGELTKVAGANAPQMQAFGMANKIAGEGAEFENTLENQQQRLVQMAQSGGFMPKDRVYPA